MVTHRPPHTRSQTAPLAIYHRNLEQQRRQSTQLQTPPHSIPLPLGRDRVTGYAWMDVDFHFPMTIHARIDVGGK